MHSLRKATQQNGRHGTLLTYDDAVGRWHVQLSSGETIRVRPANLRAFDDYHPLLLTPTALDDPANLWCLPPGPLWWSNALLDLQDDFHTVIMAEIDRAGVQGGITLQAPPVALDPGVPTDPLLGRPKSMRFINGRKLPTVGDYRNLSPAERSYLDDQERCWTGFRWPGRDRDRRPAWRPRPLDGYPLSDSLRCVSEPACQAGSAPISACAQSGMREQAGERTCGQPYMCLIHDIKQDTSGYWASTPPSHSYLTACPSIAGDPRPRTRDVELEEGSRNPLSDLMATVIPREADSRPRNHPIPAPTDRCYPRHTKATPCTAVTPARDASTHAFGWP